jgi:3-oxoacyl-[acyl-carrier protein] reductase
MTKLNGKAAVIIGADDLGKAIGVLFAKEGASVVFGDIDENAAKAAADEVNKVAGGKGLGLAVDVTKRDDTQKFADAAAQKFGGINILVNNERAVADANLKDMTEEQWDTVMNVRHRGLFHVIQSVDRYMRREELKGATKTSTGKIINIMSISGILGSQGRVNFSTSEAAITGLTKQLAKEWCRYKINVNAVVHGFVDGKLSRTKLSGSDIAASKAAQGLLKVPILNLWDRNATLDEVAKPVLFLASDDAEFITGEILNVTGGLSAGY